MCALGPDESMQNVYDADYKMEKQIPLVVFSYSISNFGTAIRYNRNLDPSSVGEYYKYDVKIDAAIAII